MSLPELHLKRFDRPSGTATAEEVVVPGQGAGVESHGEGDRRPVIGVSWNPATSCLLELLVGASGDDFDALDIDEVLDCSFEDVPSLSGDATPGLQDGQTPFQLVLHFAPLVFGHHDLHARAEHELTPTAPKQLSNENAGVCNDDHSVGMGRRRSNSRASSSSVMPASSRTWPTAAPSRATARRTSSSSLSSGM